MKLYLFECRECGIRVLAVTQPQDREWADGHKCRFHRIKKEGEVDLPLPTRLCPRCRKRTLFEDNKFNALSMDLSYVCPICGEKELADELYKLRQIPD